MEKIYEEKEKKQSKKKKIKIDGVTMLSFAVALFAIVSLIAAGISGFSFALPSSTVTLPSTFTGTQDDSLYMKDGITMQEVDYHYYTSGSTETPLLCLQRNVDFNPGTFNEVASGEIGGKSASTVSDDVGLLYLLANIYPNVDYTFGSGFNVPSGKDKYVKFWISQMAVWAYLNGSTNNNVTALDISGINWVFIGTDAYEDSILGGDTCSDTARCFGFISSTDKPLFNNVTVNGVPVSTIINTAKNKKDMSHEIVLSDGEGVITTDADDKYYFSPLYEVTAKIDPSIGELVSYNISVKTTNTEGKDIDVGAVVTDKDGNVQTNITSIKLADLSKFYIRVPKEKITENTKVSVVVKGSFKMYDGKLYTSGANTQEVTTVQFSTKPDDDGKDFTLAPVGPTGISAGQTIYFVGLIVLLCGVGIIYANAKPAKAQD